MVLMASAVVMSDVGLNTSLERSLENNRINSNAALIHDLNEYMLEMRFATQSVSGRSGQTNIRIASGQQKQLSAKAWRRPNRRLKIRIGEKLLGDLEKKAAEFQQGFWKMPALYRRQTEAYKRALVNGGVMGEALEQLMEATYQEKNLDKMRLVAQVRRDMLLTRLAITKYLKTEASADFEQPVQNQAKNGGAGSNPERPETQIRISETFSPDSIRPNSNTMPHCRRSTRSSASRTHSKILNDLNQNGPEVQNWLLPLSFRKPSRRMPCRKKRHCRYPIRYSAIHRNNRQCAGYRSVVSMARAITRPLRNAVAISERIAEGD